MEKIKLWIIFFISLLLAFSFGWLLGYKSHAPKKPIADDAVIEKQKQELLAKELKRIEEKRKQADAEIAIAAKQKVEYEKKRKEEKRKHKEMNQHVLQKAVERAEAIEKEQGSTHP